MDPTIPYLACVLGAVAVYALLRPAKRAAKAIGAVFGLGAFAWLLVMAADFVSLRSGPGGAEGAAGLTRHPDAMFVVFSVIAVAAAVRMITHQRPVYSALYFIMVVLSSAALFLLLEAEFMAFALVIVYAGAILITYLFVLMLAQQAPTGNDPAAEAHYDVVPREPAAASVVAFFMLALLTKMVFTGVPGLPSAPSPQHASARAWQQLERMPRELQATVQTLAPGSILVADPKISVRDGKPYVRIIRPGESQDSWLALPPEAAPNNVQLVGLDLVSKFPASLEMAGVILLLAMFGAVVLARKQIELGEDEIREAAGMRRLDFHADDPADARAPQLSGMRGNGHGGTP